MASTPQPTKPRRGLRDRRALRLLRNAPLAGSYTAAVALALLALCPFIVLTTAASLFQAVLVKDLGTTVFGAALAGGLANAAYAFGAVASADLIQRIPGRRLLVACEIGFVAGSLLAGLASGIVVFTVGRFVQGLATGMLLVAALPPLVTKHGSERLPSTAAYVNLGLFGMVTLGPVVGGIAGDLDAWRVVFLTTGALGVAGGMLGLLAFEHADAARPGMSFDWLAIPLAVGATVLPFFGVAWLSAGGFTSAAFFVPVAAGLAVLLLLVVGQYRKREPLMPVRPITNTLPVVGTGGAMVVGAAFTTLIELVEVYLLMVEHRGPLAVGGLVSTQVVGIVLAAWLFKRVLPTKWTPVLALAGLLSVAVSATLLLVALRRGSADAVVPIAGVLLGFGAGAGVAPGLFLAGFSVPSSKIGPTFALVELLRSEAAFLIGPVLVALAASVGLASGIRLALAITLAFVVISGLGLVGVYLLGGARPHEPDLEGWLAGEETAYHSPRMLESVRDI